MAAAATLGFVLRETAKLIAPFTPFFAEALWDGVRGGSSVHLADWPKASVKLINRKLLKGMEEARRLAGLVLARRAEARVKIRQPLTALSVKSALDKKLLEILGEEANVKKVVRNPKIKDEIELDTKITPELKEEGIIREVVRMVQDLRQKAGLVPNDKIVLMVELPGEIRRMIESNERLLKNEVGAKSIQYKKSAKFDAEIETKFDGADVWIGLRKI